VRIGLVSREYPPETAHGGIGTQTMLKAHGLAARGHDVVVLSASTNRNWSDSAASGVRVVRIPTGEGKMPLYTEAAEWLTYSVEVARAITKLHAEAAFDLLDFPEWGGEGFMHLLNQTEWNRIPSVVQLHGPIVMFAHAIGWPLVDSDFYRIGSTMEGTSLRLADAIYSSSACSADWSAEHYGVKRDEIPIIHTGVDTRIFTPESGMKAAHPTIVFAGRVTGDKGVPALVDAALHLVKEIPDLRVEICGRGEPSLISDLRKKARSVGAPPALLNFRGFVDRTTLPSVLAQAHVFAGPSAYEPGPGLVYLEAMACGLPVVACSGAGAAEVVEAGRNGLLVPPRNVEALTAALRQVLTNESDRERMAAEARRYAVEEADSELCLTRLEEFYTAALSRAKVEA
jgi:glycosyltransferase involved in cell wall biosynthesis